MLLQVLVLGPQSPRKSKLPRTSHSANSPLCVITWSINSVTATVHDVTVKNILLTEIRYYLLMSVSKPFIAVTQVVVLEESPCPRGSIHQYTSTCPCPRTLSPIVNIAVSPLHFWSINRRIKSIKMSTVYFTDSSTVALITTRCAGEENKQFKTCG